jgi:nucleoside-diphosphate-sugar epimerase
LVGAAVNWREQAPEQLVGPGASELLESDRRIVVVGAGGWLGLATLDLLNRLLGAQLQERLAVFGSSERELVLRGGLRVRQEPLAGLRSLTHKPSIVLHLAFLTQEKAKLMSEADYVTTNRAISRAVLEALDGIGAECVFLPSSGAAHPTEGQSASVRLYGELKREDEAVFLGWAEARKTSCIAARIFNLSGPYINKHSSYALACFIADALAERPIEIRATHPVYRSYVAISELMSVVFGVSRERGACERFDTAGECEVEMSELVSAVLAVLGGTSAIQRPALAEGPVDRYVGDGARYQALRRELGVPQRKLHEQIAATAQFMADATEGGRGGGMLERA